MKNFLLILTCILCSTCGTRDHSGLTDTNREIVISEVRQMLHDYFDVIHADGLRGEFKFLDDSDDFFWVPPGFNSAISYDSVKTILESNSDLYTKIDFNWDTLRILPLGSTYANYTGIVEGAMYTITGDTLNVRMIETGTVIKRNEGWKILSGQSRNLENASTLE